MVNFPGADSPGGDPRAAIPWNGLTAASGPARGSSESRGTPVRGAPREPAGRADRDRWTLARYWIFQEPSGCRQATP